MWGMAEIFIDTMVVCTVTALVLLVSGVYEPQGFLSRIQTGGPITDGTTLTGMAFATVIPWGRQFLAAATALFALATILGWSCFGEQTAEYLGKEKGVALYRLVYILVTLPGCILGAPDDMGTIGCLKWYDGCSKPAGSVFSGAGSAV